MARDRLSPPPINFEYTIKRTFQWIHAALIPGVIFLAGLIILVYGESSDIYGLSYLPLFLLGNILSIWGIIWLAIVTVREMRHSFKEDKIHEHTKEYMKHKEYAAFYWAYAGASILGLILAIITGNENLLDVFVILVVIIGLLLHYKVKRK